MLYRGTFEGGCFCGAVRYAFTDVFDAGYCHCSICRRSSGAPVMAYANTPRAGFRLLRGTPRFMASSARYQRAFCSDCATSMWTQSIDPLGWELVSVHCGTLDRAADIEPAIHLCHDDRLPWLHIDDALPRVAADTVPHPRKRNDPRWSE